LAALSPKRIPNRGFPDDAIDQYRAVVATTGFFDAAVAESAAFEGSLSELRAARTSQSSSLPLSVISRGRWGPPVAGQSEAENQQAWQMWQILQADLVGLSSQSTHVVADQSDQTSRSNSPIWWLRQSGRWCMTRTGETSGIEPLARVERLS
jgi:hypothetical protein